MTSLAESSLPEMRVVSFAGAFLPGYRGGGPIKSMKYLLDTAPANVTVTLVAGDRDLGDARPYPGLSGQWRDYGRHRIFYLNWRNPRHWARIVRAIRADRADLLYLNSCFSPFFSIVPLVLHHLSLLPTGRVVLAPRGEFSPGALDIKGTKKRTFIRATRSLLYNRGILWHASTEMEARDIRRIHPNATVLSSVDSVGDEPMERVLSSTQIPSLVFIGRVSPKKNLLFALQLLERTGIEATFDIYGPLEDTSYWRQCQEVIARLGPQTRVKYRGELTADLVCSVFSHYDAFLFPTYGENFGHVIPEALSSGCLVLCSDATPWSDLLEAGSGAAIPLSSVESWERTLVTLASQTPQERTARRDIALRTYAQRRSRLGRTNVFGEVAALVMAGSNAPATHS